MNVQGLRADLVDRDLARAVRQREAPGEQLRDLEHMPEPAVAERASAPTWAEVFKDVIGKAKGLPADSADNHDHYLYGVPKRR